MTKLAAGRKDKDKNFDFFYLSIKHGVGAQKNHLGTVLLSNHTMLSRGG